MSTPAGLRVVPVKSARKRMKAAGTRPVFMELPADLYRAAKVEARAQGFRIRDVMANLLLGWLQEGATWREFLAEQAARPEASARGRPAARI